VQIFFRDIDNIHEMRDAYNLLIAACKTDANDQDFHAKMGQSKWLYYLRVLLQTAMDVVEWMEEGKSVIVHCSDGWDRTTQICSLVALLIDPFYRTRRGFAILVEKDWLSFGHPFAERCGHAENEHESKQRSPIFSQWLECVYQILRQLPSAFEFNEDFLLALEENLYSCRFGTFLCNGEKARQEKDLVSRTVSVWSWVCHPTTHNQFLNPAYIGMPGSLRPSSNVKKMMLWERKYFCWDLDCTVKDAQEDGHRRLQQKYEILLKAHNKSSSPSHSHRPTYTAKCSPQCPRSRRPRATAHPPRPLPPRPPPWA